MMAVGRTLAVVSVLFASAAFADEETVPVKADVVLALARDGGADDPPSISPMKSKMQKSGLSVSTLKRLSSQELSLSLGKESTLNLPNGRKATVKLEKLKDDTAHVKVSVEKLFEGITYRLGREGSLFVSAGAHQNGTLVLVLSPAEGAAKKDEEKKEEEKK